LPTANEERRRETEALSHDRQVTPSAAATEVSSSKRALQAAHRYSKIGIGGTMRELDAAIQGARPVVHPRTPGGDGKPGGTSLSGSKTACRHASSPRSLFAGGGLE
jgi:hypothetical protein